MSLDLNDLSGVVSASTISSSDTYENPNGVLDNEAFFQLFLTELQNQDPTEPMDSDKILSQTSQMTELEAQEEMKDTLEAITEAFQAFQYNAEQSNAVSMIGRIAETGNTTIEREAGEGTTQFDLYFDQVIDNGTIKVYDENNTIVQSYSMDDFAGQSGMITLEWDGTNSNGEAVDAGEYTVVAEYTSAYDGEDYTATLGRGVIESVKFEEGSALLKIGSSYIPLEEATEFY